MKQNCFVLFFTWHDKHSSHQQNNELYTSLFLKIPFKITQCHHANPFVVWRVIYTKIYITLFKEKNCSYSKEECRETNINMSLWWSEINLHKFFASLPLL